MKHARRLLGKSAWGLTVLSACGGTTTAGTRSTDDGGFLDSSPNAGADHTACECPSTECPQGSQPVTRADRCCPECVPCDYSQCVAPECGLGSRPITPPNGCCAECEPQACPSVDYQSMLLCGIYEPTRATGCTFILSPFPPSPDDLDVLVNCELTTRPRYGDGGALLAGDWVLDYTTDPPTIQIIGAVCDLLTQEPTTEMQVLYGCPVI